MNRKMLPIMFMLIAGVITCIATWIHGYSVLEKLVILLVVLLIFGTLGSLLQYTMNCFDKQNQKKKEAEEQEKAMETEAQNKQEG